MEVKLSNKALANVLLIQGYALRNNYKATQEQTINGILESLTEENAKTIAHILSKHDAPNKNTEKTKLIDGRGRKKEQTRYVLDSKIVKLSPRQEYKLKGVYGGKFQTAIKMLEDQITKTGIEINCYEALIRKERPIYKSLIG